MSYLLIEAVPSPGELRHTIPVDVCGEDGTVYDSKFLCPTCSVRSIDA